MPALGVNPLEEQVDVLRGREDPGQFGDVSDRNVRQPRYLPGGEALNVGLTVIPYRVAPEKSEKRRRHPGRLAINLLEVVQDRLLWRFPPVQGEEVRPEHDAVALVVVETSGQEAWGLRRFFVRAPDGNVINIVNHRD